MIEQQPDSNKESLRKQISQLDAADFDGHTCFKDLSPEQRIDWLAELVVFVHECRLSRADNVTRVNN